MLRFQCDYGEGAHPEIIKLLAESNMEQTEGYGEDRYCVEAAELIRESCKSPEADVHFLVGGTQANLTLISAALRPHQGVLSAESGHINIHESGAIEATGHKVLSLPSPDGKITAQQVDTAVREHFGVAEFEHIVQPKLVYISNPTEVGTIYSNAELSALSEVCIRHDLYLYMDGVRLGYGLEARSNDLSLPRVSELCDAFYIGGTKVGALFGEAMVISNAVLKKDFRYIIKQKGGMLAKGRLLGIQFLALFRDGEYFRISRHANDMAGQLFRAFQDTGHDFLTVTDTNQIFPILSNEEIEKLSKKYSFAYWRPVDEKRSAVRFCTSWATAQEAVDALVADIRTLNQ